MSFAMGLLLAYLKVAMLAAVIIAGLWAVGKAFLWFYNWERKTLDDAIHGEDKPAGDTSPDKSPDGRQ